MGHFGSCTYQKCLGVSLNIGTLSRDMILSGLIFFLTINDITTNGEPRVREEAGDIQAQVPEPESRQWWRGAGCENGDSS